MQMVHGSVSRTVIASPDVVSIGSPLTRRTFFGAALAAAALARDTARDAASQATPAAARPILPVGVHASPNPGSVNLFWVETPDGLVIIDGLRTPTDARDAVLAMRRLGRPVLAAFLTHSHPDHLGGFGVLQDAFGPFPIYADQETIDILREDRQGLLALAREVPGDDFPEQVILPDRAVADGEEIILGGVGFRVRLLGPGEGPAMTVIEAPAARALFAGDIVDHRMTPFLLEEQTGPWIDQLLRLAADYPEVGTIYPGHGAPGPHAMIAEQLGYLTTIRELVGRRLIAAAARTPPDEETVLEQLADGASAGIGGLLTALDKETVLAEINALYPGYQPVATLPLDLVLLNIDAVANELATEG